MGWGGGGRRPLEVGAKGVEVLIQERLLCCWARGGLMGDGGEVQTDSLGANESVARLC